MGPDPRDIESLALEFVRTRTRESRERLCEAALPLVRRLAASVLRRLPAHFNTDDLIGDGCLGLLRAVDRYDPSQGAAFETWATRLVRGAMLNGLRRMDLIPERVRRDARNLESARWRMAQESGAAPSDREAARSAGLDEQRLEAVQLALTRAATISLDAPARLRFGEKPTIDRIACNRIDPGTSAADASLRDAILRALRALSLRERRIIAWFYAGNVNFREIGLRLGISKQRVSQLHCRAMLDLRSALKRHREI
jgi:RNA polymerase sigma factor for flagellar operon FliA